MSGTHLPLLSRGPDPLDDPLNLEWDGIVRNERPASPEIDPDDFDLLRRVHAQANRALPDPDFFGELEHRLTGLYGLPAPKPALHPRVSRDRSGTPPTSRGRMLPVPPPNRWIPVLSAFAVLALLLAAGIVVLLRATPGIRESPPIPAAVIAAPELQTIARLDFEPPLWGMPDATNWTHMEVGLFAIDPGTSFTTDIGFYTCVDGPLMLRVVSGVLSIQPAGPAFSYVAGQQHEPPVDVSAGSTVAMQPNDTLVYSAVDAASGRNPGNEPAIVLYGLTGSMDDSIYGCGVFPNDVRSVDFNYSDYFDPVSSKGATVSLQRLELHPFDSFVYDPSTSWRFLPALDSSHVDGLRLYQGRVESLSPNDRSESIDRSQQLLTPGIGPDTLVNLGQETVDIYFFVVEPYPAPATPTP